MSFDDNYFVFHADSLSYAKYYYNVKTKAEWEKLGFKINLSDLGRPLNDKHLGYHFVCAKLNDINISNAIRTGKKGTTNPLIVSQLYQMGIPFDEFVALPDAVKLYCQAEKFFVSGNYLSAFPYIEKCVSLKNEPEYSEWEHRYKALYFKLGRKLLKIDLLLNELDYYVNDMNSFQYKEWTDVLIKMRQHNIIKPMLAAVKEGIMNLMNNLPRGKRNSRSQSIDYYKHTFEEIELFEAKTYNILEKKERSSLQKEIAADAVAKIIYDFVQDNLGKYVSEKDFNPELEQKIFSLMYEDHLTEDIIRHLNEQERIMLCSLLTQYILFLTMNEENLKFPGWFLQNKRKGTIPFNILHYIELHRWPYPQMLHEQDN